MYTEFLAATIEAHGHIEEDRIAEAFDRIDSDDTGYSTSDSFRILSLRDRYDQLASHDCLFLVLTVSKENLREALGKDCSPEEVDEIMAVCRTTCFDG